MIKFEVFTEAVDRRRDTVEAVEVATWLDVSDVFSVRADSDPEWAVITFRLGAGPRSLIVRGTAETVALAIGAEKDRQRRPARRMRTQRVDVLPSGSSESASYV